MKYEVFYQNKANNPSPWWDSGECESLQEARKLAHLLMNEPTIKAVRIHDNIMHTWIDD